MKITLYVSALENCKPDCPKFELHEYGSVFVDGRLQHYFECANRDLCEELQKVLKEQEEEQ